MSAGAVRGRVAMRAAGPSGEVMVPEGESDAAPSSAGSAQFESDDLQVRDPVSSDPSPESTTNFFVMRSLDIHV